MPDIDLHERAQFPKACADQFARIVGFEFPSFLVRFTHPLLSYPLDEPKIDPEVVGAADVVPIPLIQFRIVTGRVTFLPKLRVSKELPDLGFLVPDDGPPLFEG